MYKFKNLILVTTQDITDKIVITLAGKDYIVPDEVFDNLIISILK